MRLYWVSLKEQNKVCQPQANSLWYLYDCKGEIASGKLCDEVFFQVLDSIWASSWSKNQHGVGGWGKLFMLFYIIVSLKREGICIFTVVLDHINSKQKTWSMGLHTTSQPTVGPEDQDMASLKIKYLGAVDCKSSVLFHSMVWWRGYSQISLPKERCGLSCWGVDEDHARRQRVSKWWDPWVVYTLSNNKGLGNTPGLENTDQECPPHQGCPHLEHIPYCSMRCQLSPSSHAAPLAPRHNNRFVCFGQVKLSEIICELCCRPPAWCFLAWNPMFEGVKPAGIMLEG